MKNFILLCAICMAAACKSAAPAVSQAPVKEEIKDATPEIGKVTANESDKNKVSMSLQTPDVELKNTRWVLRMLNGKEVVLKENDKEPYITFMLAEDKVQGNSSCNNFGGTAQTNTTDITFNPLIATRMACQDMTIENQFFAIMVGTVNYSIDSKWMTWTRDGKTVARFEAVYLK